MLPQLKLTWTILEQLRIWLRGYNAVVVSFEPDELARLERLAESKGESIESCLRAFTRSCQPGGSGWVHPSRGGESD